MTRARSIAAVRALRSRLRPYREKGAGQRDKMPAGESRAVTVAPSTVTVTSHPPPTRALATALTAAPAAAGTTAVSIRVLAAVAVTVTVLTGVRVLIRSEIHPW